MVFGGVCRYLDCNYLFLLGVNDMENDLPESHYVEAYLVNKPSMIEWFDEVEGFIRTEAYSA